MQLRQDQQPGAEEALRKLKRWLAEGARRRPPAYEAGLPRPTAVALQAPALREQRPTACVNFTQIPGALLNLRSTPGLTHLPNAPCASRLRTGVNTLHNIIKGPKAACKVMNTNGALKMTGATCCGFDFEWTLFGQALVAQNTWQDRSASRACPRGARARPKMTKGWKRERPLPSGAMRHTRRH